MSAVDKSFQYAVPVSEKKEGETPIYRSWESPNELQKSPFKGVTNMQEFFIKQSKDYADQPLLGTQSADNTHYTWRSYKQSSEIAQRLGTSILKNNLFQRIASESENIPEINHFGIYSKNREEWLLLEFASYFYNLSTVPLYDTLGPDSMSFIMEQTQMNSIFISAENVPKLLKLPQLHQLKNIISFDELDASLQEQIKIKGLNLVFYHDLLAVEESEIAPFHEIHENSIYSFCYTSGTTGHPKGVLQTHKNALSFLAACINKPGSFGILPTDVHYSYLPLPHVYERQICLTIMMGGGSIGFYGGDISKMTQDLLLLKPTLFASVPRIFNRYYSKIKESFQALPQEQRAVVDQAFAEKLAIMRENPDRVVSEKWDNLVFKKVRESLGGRVRGFVTGGAALSGEISEFLKIVFSCCFNEGYGQTECFGGAFNNIPTDGNYGNVGGIQTSLEFKLVDIPEMGYLSTDISHGQPAPRGEIWLRGNQVCAGYFKDPEKTSQTIDSDGWLHTGDVAEMMPDKSIKLIDRKGNLFKLSQGEYVAPEKIENIYSRAPGVTEAYVHGEPLRSYLVGLLIVDGEYLTKYAKTNGIEGTLKELCDNPKIIAHVFANAIEEGKKAELNGIEQVKAVKLDPTPLISHGVTTNTFKIKRPDARRVFKDIMTQLYEETDAKFAASNAKQ